MKDRLREVRKAIGLTQQEFSDRLGIQRNAVANCESGRAELSDAVITLICRTYNVDEVWLRTGAGEMFRPRSREDEITAFLGGLIGAEGTDFQRRFISVLAKLGPDEWDLLERRIRQIAGEE